MDIICNYKLNLSIFHKFHRWRFVISGGIDGFSRLITFLRPANNNQAQTSLAFFIDAISDYGLPSRTRTDLGGEYVSIRRYMEDTAGRGRGSSMTGRSVHNSRIERLWRDVYVKVLDKYYRLFYHLEDNHVLDIDNSVHIFALHYTFLPRLSHDLDTFRSSYNNHGLRTEHFQTPLMLWTSGLLEQFSSNQHSTAINNIFGNNSIINNSDPHGDNNNNVITQDDEEADDDYNVAPHDDGMAPHDDNVPPNDDNVPPHDANVPPQDDNVTAR